MRVSLFEVTCALLVLCLVLCWSMVMRIWFNHPCGIFMCRKCSLWLGKFFGVVKANFWPSNGTTLDLFCGAFSIWWMHVTVRLIGDKLTILINLVWCVLLKWSCMIKSKVACIVLVWIDLVMFEGIRIWVIFQFDISLNVLIFFSTKVSREEYQTYPIFLISQCAISDLWCSVEPQNGTVERWLGGVSVVETSEGMGAFWLPGAEHYASIECTFLRGKWRWALALSVGTERQMRCFSSFDYFLTFG